MARPSERVIETRQPGTTSAARPTPLSAVHQKTLGNPLSSMKSLSLLVLIALAVLTPGIHASGDNPGVHSNTAQTSPALRGSVDKAREQTRLKKLLESKVDLGSLFPEMRDSLLRYLPQSGKGALARTSRSFKEDVDSVRDISLLEKLLDLFQQLKLPRPEETTIQSLVAAMKASRDKKSLPLYLLISTISYGMLHMHPDKAIKLAQLAMPEDTTINITPDRLSLLQLFRAGGGDSRIEKLIKKNAKLFKGGLGINEKWMDHGFLKWFLKELWPVSEIRYSPDDFSATLCFAMYSELNPQVLTGQVSATREDLTEVLKSMKLMARGLQTRNEEMALPDFTRLNSVKAAPPVTDRELFNIKEGLYTCLARHPSIGELIEGLDSLSIDGIMDERMLYKKASAIVDFAFAIGMNVEDMLWAASYPWDAQSFNVISVLFEHLFAGMAGSSVLEWSTQSWLIQELIDRNKYYAAAMILRLNYDHAFLPGHISDDEFVQIWHFLNRAENGTKLSKASSAILNTAFGSHQWNKGLNRT